MFMNKAQSSTEFLIIVAISMALLVPASIIFINYVQSSTSQVSANQINVLGTEIMNKAEEMYLVGENSWTTIEISFPSVFANASVNSNSDLVFNYETQSGVSQLVYFSQRFNISDGGDCATSCDLNLTPGINRIRIQYDEGMINIVKT